MMQYIYAYILFTLALYGFVGNIQGYLSRRVKFGSSHSRIVQAEQCPEKDMCRSQWGYCGIGPDYCGTGCQSGSCTTMENSTRTNIINEKNFQCAFSDLGAATRAQRLDGLNRSDWKPLNSDEAAVFLSHVYHETDGLKTLTEHCAPQCGPNYAQSWCNIRAVPGNFYYGRGWFQLSYPCNYYAAGRSLGLDLLNNPDLVSQQQDVAVKTAIWFYQTTNMSNPARQGDFAATTRIINGKQECDGGPGGASQRTRVATCKRIRQCFGLGAPKKDLSC